MVPANLPGRADIGLVRMNGALGNQVRTARLAGIVRAVRSHIRQSVAETSGSTRVWLFTLLLAAITAALALVLVPPEAPVDVPITIPVWLLAAGFYLAEAKVIHLHIGRSAHSFSMSELPLVAGLFLIAPPAFIVARIVGSGLALVLNRRQRSVKLAFNLVQFTLASVISVAIVHLTVAPDRAFGPGVWLAVLMVALVENVIGAVAVSTAISLAEGTAQYRRDPRDAQDRDRRVDDEREHRADGPHGPVGEPGIGLAVRPAHGDGGHRISRLYLGTPAARKHRVAL